LTALVGLIAIAYTSAALQGQSIMQKGLQKDIGRVKKLDGWHHDIAIFTSVCTGKHGYNLWPIVLKLLTNFSFFLPINAPTMKREGGL
jgi:hypothetical protein